MGHMLIHNEQIIAKCFMCYLAEHKTNYAPDLLARQFPPEKKDGKLRNYLTSNQTNDIIT